MKSVTIILVSHYYAHQLRLRVSEQIASRLAGLARPIEVINKDCDRQAEGRPTLCLSEGQTRKVRKYFAPGDCDYFDYVCF